MDTLFRQYPAYHIAGERDHRRCLCGNQIILTAVLLVIAVAIEKTMGLEVWQLLLVYLVPFLLIGYDVIGEAIEGIREGEVFDEDFLMCIATIGAMLIGFLPGAETEFPEAVFVMLFFQLGELFEHYAEDNSRKSISHLMEIRPDTANVVRNGKTQVVDPGKVAVGETIIVRPGEKIPLDGKITEGETSLNTMALTGESMPRNVGVGDGICSGCVNLSGVIKMIVEKSFGESTVSKILDLVENAGENKSKSETFITKFAHIYTPIVVYVALALAFLPPFLSDDYLCALPIWVNRDCNTFTSSQKLPGDNITMMFHYRKDHLIPFLHKLVTKTGNKQVYAFRCSPCEHHFTRAAGIDKLTYRFTRCLVQFRSLL